MAAAREVEEETGLVVMPSRLLVVEHLARTSTGASGLRFIFDAAPISPGAHLTKQDGEVSDLLWLPPDQAVQRHVSRGRNRLEVALSALSNGTTAYIDDYSTLR